MGDRLITENQLSGLASPVLIGAATEAAINGLDKSVKQAYSF